MRVFITGVSSGIGRALVKELIAGEHEVWGIARRAKQLELLSKEIGSTNFRYDTCDVSEMTDNRQLLDKMTAENYVPDIVILNAAVDLEDEYPALSMDFTSQMMRTNFEGAYFWVTAFIKPFLDRGYGQFLAVSSLFSQWPDPASVSYSASKSALSMLFRGLRIRYSRTDLRFKLLNLGPVDTPINPRFADEQPRTSAIVASAPATARHIARFMDGRSLDSYFPFYVFGVFTFLRWLPDKWFEFITAPFKR